MIHMITSLSGGMDLMKMVEILKFCHIHSYHISSNPNIVALRYGVYNGIPRSSDRSDGMQSTDGMSSPQAPEAPGLHKALEIRHI